MSLDEKIISEAIISKYFEDFKRCLNLDVAIVGGGPSGLTAAYHLPKRALMSLFLNANSPLAVACGEVE